ncbi:MAG: hypothetical protein L0G63_02075 [Psychrobacter sp.]|uniref:hypothetical protein n=1 Tax=Psychrobacter sp. TaxID=56811 RepID=UPI002649DF55|nr:hypothetical protein [Psychrobacter sp.]MDN5619256.1 hypothetical protein [Psychrobacter sp.]
MTDRNPTPPGKSYRTQLAKALLGESTVASIEEAKPKKHMSVEDWLLRDHQRNALRYDVESIKRSVSHIQIWLCIGITLLALVLVMQLLMWFAKTVAA